MLKKCILILIVISLSFLPPSQIYSKTDTHISDGEDDITIVPRSKSSDILKKDSLYWPTDVSSTKPSTSRIHFNSLKLWGNHVLNL